MAAQGEQANGYLVPTYKAPPGQCWYHFLHGNVPGHQIDFIYRPTVPDGPITPQHFSHLSRLVRYIEPRSRSAYAFAIGNLSRDDTQYEPGRGGVALIFGLRIRGALDHAGRQDPPFCHAVAAVDRHLSEATLLEASAAFYRKLLPDEASEAEGSGWYRSYVRHGQNPDALLPLLRSYVADFDDLPAPGPSALGLRWRAGDAAAPRRVVIVHGESDPFELIAACATRIAGVLVASDIRWTAISNGRDIDIPGGVSVRFVPEQEAREEPGTLILRREDVPADPGELAEQLFGAQPARDSQKPGPRKGWRQLYGKDTGGGGGATESKDAALEAGAGSRRGEKASARSGGLGRVLVGLGAMLTLAGVVVGAGALMRKPKEESARQIAPVPTVPVSTGAEEKATPTPMPAPTVTAEAPSPAADAPSAAANAPPAKQEARAAPLKSGVRSTAEGTRRPWPAPKKEPSILDVP